MDVRDDIMRAQGLFKEDHCMMSYPQETGASDAIFEMRRRKENKSKTLDKGGCMSPATQSAKTDGREVMIEVEGLSRYYGPVAAIDNISFTAYRGEVLGFLGPNGAGKTTAMRMLTGYLPPSEGTARIAGNDVVNDSMQARREIGYLPEHTPLYPEMTIAGYLHFMARLRGVKNRHEAVENVMQKVSLDHRADDLIGHLSKGFRQRVGIAQALVHDPSVIILDEPTIGLDPRQIRDVRGVIDELGGDHTVILSTHILPEAQQLCDRVLIINGGRIVAEDSPDRLTALLTGGDHVRVHTDPSIQSSDVEKAMKDVAGVESIHNDGGGVYTVTAVVDSDPRAAIAERVIQKGWPLLELARQRMTLEDVFMEMTGNAAESMDLVEEEDSASDKTSSADSPDSKQEEGDDE